MRVPRAGALRHVAEGLCALAAVAIVSLVLDTFAADQTVAALVLVVLGVLLTLVGPVAAVAAIVASFTSLNFFFLPPKGAFGIEKVDDLFALAALVITTTLLGSTLVRVNRLRSRADQREHQIRTRLALSNRLVAGDDPDAVVSDAEAALRSAFHLPALTLRQQDAGGLVLEVGDDTAPVAPSNREEIAAFVLELGSALERVRLAREVREAQVAAAVEASRAGFLAAMTHNLRTPLATIKASVSSLMTDEPLSGRDARVLLVAAYTESDRLERLVTKVLALSRIRAGTITATLESVEVAETAQIAVQRVAVLAGDRELVLDITADLLMVRADPALLEVVLVNLLENALRYAPNGRIVIRGRATAAGTRIEVEDAGPGIAAEERERVFEEFVRGAGEHDSSGAGIGLAIARAFVEAQGGTISIGAPPGGGTRVTIVLPTATATP